MPEIAKDLISSVVTLTNGFGLPIGTGFVVEFMDPIFKRSYYLITCDHCTENAVSVLCLGKNVLTVNPEDWTRPKTGDDIAIIDITDLKVSLGVSLGYSSIGERVSIPPGFFDVGVDVYMLGLLVDDKNRNRSLIRARFGNLSAFADSGFPMEQGNGKDGACHLVDMRSRGGFSGSPVFAYYENPGLSGGVNQRRALLGVHSAQHQEPVKIAGYGDYLIGLMPSSLARVVPAWVVHDLLESDDKLIERRAIRNGAEPSS